MMQKQVQTPTKPPGYKKFWWLLLIVIVLILSIFYLVKYPHSLFPIIETVKAITNSIEANFAIAVSLLSLLFTAVGAIYTLLTFHRKPPKRIGNPQREEIPSAKPNNPAQMLEHLSLEKSIEQSQFKSIFLPKMPLTDAKEFFGREEECRELRERTLSGGSTIIVGSKKIGKTWMIRHLIMTLQNPQARDQFRIADMRPRMCRTLKIFTENTLNLLGFDNTISKSPFEMLEIACKQLNSQGVIPVICIDNIDKVSNKVFIPKLYQEMSPLCDRGELVIVATCKMPVSELSFFQDLDFVSFISLEGFSENEANDFIAAKSEKAEFTSEERAFLLNCTIKADENNKLIWLPIHLQEAGKQLLYHRDRYKGDNSYSAKLADNDFRQEFISKLSKI